MRTFTLILAFTALLGAQTTPGSATTGRTTTGRTTTGRVAPPAKATTAAKAIPPKLDKPKLEAYFRHLFVWPPPIEISIADPIPGPMPGYWELKVTGRQGPNQLTETFYVSQDQKKLIRGQVFDTAQNPFKPDLEKLKTEFQPSLGTPGASVVLVEFSDFQCQYCREEAKTLRENLLKDYPKDVRLYFVTFPLEQIHPWAKAAAMMSRCIFHQEASAFWDYHDWAFEHQAEITPENLRAKSLDFAKTKGLDVEQLAKCFDSKLTEEEVTKNITLGKDLDVQSTPTIFINGRRVAGALGWPELKRIIDFEIDYQKTAKNAGENCGCDLRLPTPGFAPAGTAPATPGAVKK